MAHFRVAESVMAETWLQTNVRALRMGMLLPGTLALAAAAIALGAAGWPAWARLACAVVAVVGVVAVLALAWLARQPRLAYQDRHLLVYLGNAAPYRVPLEAVECFLLGQGPSLLPGAKHRGAEARTVIVRLAEKATEWEGREVKAALGKWCGGYITLRGTWCEPLDVNVVKRLNRRLAEVGREAQFAGAAP